VNIRVLGIDPGTAVTGFGVVEPASGHPGQLIECGVIRTNPRQEICSRLQTIYDGINEIIERHKPSVVAVESIFYGKNVRTTVALGQVRGVILLAAARAGVEVAEFPPATVKKYVVGEGGAVKDQVGYMVQRLLRLKEPPAPSDASDACAIALTYLFSARIKV
jgi:crossover junction endodeoxyribonuclease RuvC